MPFPRFSGGVTADDTDDTADDTNFILSIVLKFIFLLYQLLFLFILRIIYIYMCISSIDNINLAIRLKEIVVHSHAVAVA